MRRVQAGSIQDAVKASYKAAGGLECAATDLGLSAALLSRAIDAQDEYRPGGLGVNYLHRLSRIVPAAAIPIAEHFARLAEGRFEKPETHVLSDCMATLMSEFSDVLKHHGEARSETSDDPSRHTPEEAKASLKEVKELRAVLDAYQNYLAGCLR